MQRACVLIEVRPDCQKEVVRKLRENLLCEDVYELLDDNELRIVNDWNLIVIVRGYNKDDISEIILKQIRTLEGVSSTRTRWLER